MSVNELHSSQHFYLINEHISESLLFFLTHHQHRIGCFKLVVTIVACQSEMSSNSRTDFVVADNRVSVISVHDRTTSPYFSSVNSSYVFARRPDAAMRCNFRFRLQVFVLVVLCLAASSAAITPTSPVANCRTTTFNDVISKAVRANVVFEGHVTSVRHREDSAASLISSQYPPLADVISSCHVTFKVRQRIKGELSSAPKSDRKRSEDRSSSSLSSVLEEFHPVVVQSTRLVENVRGGDTGKADVDWCHTALDGTATMAPSANTSRITYIVFLSHAGGDKTSTENGVTRPTSSTSHRNKRVRGSGTSNTVFRFSSPPIVSSKDIVRQLLDIDFDTFARAPGAKLTLSRSPKGKQQANHQQSVSQRVGSRFQLTCRAVNGRPAVVAFVWTKDGVCLQSGNRTKITQNKAKSNSQLLIKSVSLEDRGIYGCQAINEVGHSIFQTIDLEVERIVKKSKSIAGTDDVSTVSSALQHKRPCDESDANYCHNGGICNILLNKKFCNCTSEFEGPRCQEKRNVINLDNEDLGAGNLRLSLRRKKRMHNPVT